MTNEDAIKTLLAKAECMKRKSSGTFINCNSKNCDECSLFYMQGTIGEQIEAIETIARAMDRLIIHLTASRKE